MLSLMRLKKYPHFLTLVLVFFAGLSPFSAIQAAPDSQITPDPVPVLKKPKKKTKESSSSESEDRLPTLQITPTEAKEDSPRKDQN